MLGTISFTPRGQNPAPAMENLPFAQVLMPALDLNGEVGSACEVWSGKGSFTYGLRKGVRYGHNDEILFGAIQLDDAQFDNASVRAAGKTPLQQASETAYLEIFGLLDALQFPHILRFWNYIANITGESHGLERYRQFNMGRQDGFLASGRKVMGSVPAASAVGYEQGPLTIYFLAGRGEAPVAIENPRQVSAYKYPQEYGPRSPTFSRASVARLGDDNVLFLSGTASIVGHRSMHVGDVLAQTRETLANITAMVGEANRVAPDAEFSLGDLCYKVYVRHPKDVPAIHGELRRALGESARLMFLKADICRQDLLVEVEATAGHPLEFAIGK
ncbi:hypothetical protein [Noviherbaspirillum massiliense]|uniref:chorismate transformation enzyme, FkbO/Hyg5 family n=1 Tax=Noviherbaspirillum massiliense TaxID=1465823 RepID=UPI001FE06115|nr:hypothetical protein [Noviherbaspirillum massiliense]